MASTILSASSSPEVFHGLGPEDLRTSTSVPAEPGASETMILDDGGRLLWMNAAKRQPIGLGGGGEIEVSDECKGLVRVDRNRLRESLIQVIRNAAEAMAGRGQLSAALTSREGWCLIDVIDTGPGISPEIQARLGQPFVSSKPAGRGAGLGLSLCQLHLSRHGGRLRVVRTGSDGTTMRLALPGAPGTGDLTS
jgi:signal transduction histidine kinase